jgi:DNA repair protein RadC
MKMEQYAYRIESRFVSEPDFPYNEQLIKKADDVVSFAKILQDSDVEKMIVLFLGTNNHLNCLQIIPGTVNYAIIYPREIIKCALLSGSYAIILVHNHPFGGLQPSEDDIRLTNALKQACKLVEVKILDHIIIKGADYYSFQEHGMI